MLAPAAEPTQTTAVELADAERAILDLERSWWLEVGSKESLIRSRLGMSPSAYYRQLYTLIDRQEARVYDPLVTRRVARARADRRRVRVDVGQLLSPPRR